MGRSALEGGDLRPAQRTGDGDRAHRHHRAGDGLRHHRHRAGLRAGQVQEAGRRRFLQDHQPAGPRGAALVGLSGRPDRGDRPLRGRPRHARRCAPHQSRIAEGQGLHRRGHRPHREDPALRLRPALRLQPLVARRGAAAAPRLPAGGIRPAGLRPAAGAGLQPRADRGGQPLRVRHRHARRGAVPEARAPAGVRLRQSVRTSRPALPVGGRPPADDGGRPALHHRRHLQDHQHAGDGHRAGLRRRLHEGLEARAEGAGALP
ncbi:hypothetical protein HRbin39_01618 [bacterium HR39]|nr:hypothetical protein HRbin39_01618 [bacterium HR39]